MKNTSIPKHVLDNRSNQLNPQHSEYYKCRGVDPSHAEVLATQHQLHLAGSSQKPPSFPVHRKSKK